MTWPTVAKSIISKGRVKIFVAKALGATSREGFLVLYSILHVVESGSKYRLPMFIREQQKIHNNSTASLQDVHDM